MSTIEIIRLIWDTVNIDHIAKHDVTSDEVEEVCQKEYVVRPTYCNRLMIIGLTIKSRMLAVIIQKKESGAYYVVTARTADKKERLIYWQEKVNTK